MAITTSTVLTTAATTQFFAGASLFQVNTPSTNLSSVVVSSDPQGENVLATLAAGTTTLVTSPGGFFYTSAVPASLTVNVLPSKLTEIIATSTVVTNVTAETITTQFSIPAGSLTATSTLKIRANANVTAYNSGTLTFKLHLGPAGTTADATIFTTGALTPAAAGTYLAESWTTVRAAPAASVAVISSGYFSTPASGSALASVAEYSGNVATNGLLYVTATFTWSAANAGNSAQLDQFEIVIG
jgi:hypothetical protein